MSSWWKSARRRGKQKILEATGACDAVVDEEWDSIWDTFGKDVANLKALEKRLLAMRPVWKKWAAALREESEGIKEYFSGAECPADLRQCSEGFSDSMHKLSRAIWPNVEEKYVGSVLEPLRRIFEEEIPAIRENSKERAGILTDVNSYRRKLQKLLSNDKADPERKQIVKAKLDKAVASFEAIDLELKTRLKKFHHERFEMMRPYANTLFFSQLDIMTRACQMMSTATDYMPADAKKQTMDTLAHMHSTRGVRPMSTMPAKTGGFWGSGTGQKKTTPSKSGGPKNNFVNHDVSRRDGGTRSNKTPQIEAENLPPTPAVLGGDSDVLMSGREDDTPDAEEDEVEDLLSAGHDVKSPDSDDGDEEDGDDFGYVVADFDFASDDGGDLPFQKGDKIKVIAKEGGWWKGSLRGKTGMFPANYTSQAGKS